MTHGFVPGCNCSRGYGAGIRDGAYFTLLDHAYVVEHVDGDHGFGELMHLSQYAKSTGSDRLFVDYEVVVNLHKGIEARRQIAEMSHGELRSEDRPAEDDSSDECLVAGGTVVFSDCQH